MALVLERILVAKASRTRLGNNFVVEAMLGMAHSIGLFFPRKDRRSHYLHTELRITEIRSFLQIARRKAGGRQSNLYPAPARSAPMLRYLGLGC